MEPPRKQPRERKAPDPPTKSARRPSSSSVSDHARSFRTGPNNSKDIPMIGKMKGHIRQKSSLSIVSGLLDRNDDDVPEEDDVFGTSSDHETDLSMGDGVARRRGSGVGLFDLPAKTKPPRVVDVTTEEDSLQRSNKDVCGLRSLLGFVSLGLTGAHGEWGASLFQVVKRQAVNILAQRGISKDSADFKELYQMTIRGATFAFVRSLPLSLHLSSSLCLSSGSAMS